MYSLSKPGFKLYKCEEEGRNLLFIMGGFACFCDHKNDFCHTKCVGCSRRERRLGQKTARIIQFSVLNKKVAIHAMLMVFFSFQQNLEMVFSYQNCSDYCEKKSFLWSRKTPEIRGWRSRICKNFEITRTIYSNSEMLF